MPIYEYRCNACSKTTEVFQKVSDPAPSVCPICHTKHQMEKAVSSTSFQLKGGGWYKDLYASQKPSATSTSSEPPKAAPATTNSSNGGTDKAI